MENTVGGRKLRTKQRKLYVDQEIDEDDIDGRRTYSLEDKLTSDAFKENYVQELKGHEFTMQWMQRNGLTRPIVFYDKAGLGLRSPSENFKVSDVKQCVGSRRILDVMDVSTQKAMEMSMKDWVKYYENPERDRLLNVISLEFSHTRLENYVESPTLVRQIDWVNRAWPRHLKERQTESTNVIEKMKYPKVQKYCLMSVAGCYTDFHIDFGGTSVWYHILHGEKIFWLAPPTQKNIDKYVEWTLSAKQGDTFLGDYLEQCQRVNLHSGYTFIIPSGYIHAVYTPKDSLVFGGNFLHSFNIENQLMASRVEDKTYVPSKFRYPFLTEMMWYVVDRYICCLTGQTFLATSEKEDAVEDEQSTVNVDEDSIQLLLTDSWSPPKLLDGSGDTKASPTNIEVFPKVELTATNDSLQQISQNNVSHNPTIKNNLPLNIASNTSKIQAFPKKWVHLTVTELKGLKHLVDYLSGLLALPVSKQGVPRDLLDPVGVLREIKQLLESHKNDNQELAVTGEPVIGWPETTKKKHQKLKFSYKTHQTSKSAVKSLASFSSIRKRRTRCKKCEACTRSECGECTYCKDMKKFGGPGRLKQTCISRQCMAPVLPSSSVCMICGKEGNEKEEDNENNSMLLMECGICWEIVHPLCQQKKFENLDNEGIINEDLPNSWECARCCNEGKQGQIKARIRPRISVKRIRSEDHHIPSDSDSGQEDKPKPFINPVEGKRVVSKEGKKIKNQSLSKISKWPLAPKKMKSLSDAEIETEESLPPSPSSSHSVSSSLQPSFKESKLENESPNFSPETTRDDDISQYLEDRTALPPHSSPLLKQPVASHTAPMEHTAALFVNSMISSPIKTKSNRRPKRDAFTPQRYRD